MSTKINNIVDLKAEIARLKLLKAEQEAYLSDQYTLLRKKVEVPSRVLGTITSSIPGVDLVKGLFSFAKSSDKGEKSDWLSNGLRLGLPLVLNRTLLRNAGWLKKTLVLFASNRAADEINEDRVGTAISKVANFIRPKKKSKKHREVASFEAEQEGATMGIPPNSETS